MLEQKLAGLEAFGQLLTDGLLDDSRSGETDLRARLSDVEVAQHGEAGSYAAGCGIGEDADEGYLGLIQAHERSRDFAELHEADRALLHARAAGCGDDHERRFRLHRALDRA